MSSSNCGVKDVDQTKLVGAVAAFLKKYVFFSFLFISIVFYFD